MALRSKQRTTWSSAAAQRILKAAGGDVTVEEAVVRVAETFRDGSSGPPTDLASVARRLGVDECRVEALPVAGELRREGDRLTVVYASGLPIGRRRFTIAHELGHAFFEQSGPHCPRRGKELERICDLFAVELLMPKEQMSTVAESGGPHAVFAAADLFGVSLSAAMYRLAELTRAHIALDDGRRRSGTLRALAASDVAIDTLVDNARQRGEADVTTRLNRNPVWNGQWRLGAEAGRGRRVVVVSAEPLVPDERDTGLVQAQSSLSFAQPAPSSSNDGLKPPGVGEDR